MNLKQLCTALAVGVSLCAASSHANAATFDIALTGNVADFTQSTIAFSGLIFDEHSLALSGLDPNTPLVVDQGDTINTTVTLDQAYTIPDAPVRTDILQFLSGDFSSNDTAMNGTFQFFLGGALVNSFGYSSSTSGQLASFAAVFPPDNAAFTFDSYTNDFTITQLDGPTAIHGANFTYALVSNAVPEPASWALMILGFGLAGATVRRRRSLAAI